MSIREAILYILKNRSMYGCPVKSANMITAIKDLTGEDINDAAMRQTITSICMEDGLLIGGTQKGFLIAQSREEAREIHAWIAYRIEPLIRHSRHFEKLALKHYGDFQQETLF